MTQQEIFQNMTKGELSATYHVGLTPLNVRFKAVHYKSVIDKHENYANAHGKSDINTEANAAAIVLAINNTYGKGINPEAVEELVNQLRQYVEFIEREPVRPRNSFYHDFKKALAAAELK